MTLSVFSHGAESPPLQHTLQHKWYVIKAGNQSLPAALLAIHQQDQQNHLFTRAQWSHDPILKTHTLYYEQLRTNTLFQPMEYLSQKQVVDSNQKVQILPTQHLNFSYETPGKTEVIDPLTQSQLSQVSTGAIPQLALFKFLQQNIYQKPSTNYKMTLLDESFKKIEHLEIQKLQINSSQFVPNEIQSSFYYFKSPTSHYQIKMGSSSAFPQVITDFKTQLITSSQNHAPKLPVFVKSWFDQILLTKQNIIAQK